MVWNRPLCSSSRRRRMIPVQFRPVPAAKYFILLSPVYILNINIWMKSALCYLLFLISQICLSVLNVIEFRHKTECYTTWKHTHLLCYYLFNTLIIQQHGDVLYYQCVILHTDNTTTRCLLIVWMRVRSLCEIWNICTVILNIISILNIF